MIINQLTDEPAFRGGGMCLYRSANGLANAGESEGLDRLLGPLSSPTETSDGRFTRFSTRLVVSIGRTGRENVYQSGSGLEEWLF